MKQRTGCNFDIIEEMFVEYQEIFRFSHIYNMNNSCFCILMHMENIQMSVEQKISWVLTLASKIKTDNRKCYLGRGTTR